MAKKKNPQDLTLRNRVAIWKRVGKLEHAFRVYRNKTDAKIAELLAKIPVRES